MQSLSLDQLSEGGVMYSYQLLKFKDRKYNIFASLVQH